MVGWRTRRGAAAGLVKIRPERRRKRPPARAETQAETARGAGATPSWDAAGTEVLQSTSRDDASGLHRARTARAAVQRLEGQSATMSGSAQAGPQGRGTRIPAVGQGAHHQARQQAQALRAPAEAMERNGPAPVASMPGRAEMTPDAKVPWLSERPAAAAPVDETVSAGAPTDPITFSSGEARHSGRWWQRQRPLCCAQYVAPPSQPA